VCPGVSMTASSPEASRSLRCPDRFDPNGFHDAIERDLRPPTSFVHECGRWPLEQEQRQAIGRDQDAPQGPDGASSRAEVGPRDSAEGIAYLALVNPWPVALDHKG
jgi:hypothetical protein